MSQKSLSSLDLAALMEELRFLKRSKISQIYHQDKEVLLQLHLSGQGKQLLRIVAGGFLCLTQKKDVPQIPSSFCLQLRKHLDGAIIKDFYQKDAERIVVFELIKQEKYFLIVELFSKGNFILTDEKYTIIGVLEPQVWKDRTVKVKESYIFPKPNPNWKTVSEEELRKIMQKSEKRNVATTLATELGMGGMYAEEICHRANINKDLLPKEMSAKDCYAIAKVVHDFLKLIVEPQGYVYLEGITAFPLVQKEPLQHKKTLSEVVDTLSLRKKDSPYQKKIISLQTMIHEQEKSLQNSASGIEGNTFKANLIYEKYQPISKLLSIVKEMKKTKDWSEVESELKKEKRIKKIDLKNKKIILDL